MRVGILLHCLQLELEELDWIPVFVWCFLFFHGLECIATIISFWVFKELSLMPFSFFFFFFFNLFIYLFIYLCLCWVFVSVWGLSLVAAGGGYSSSQCAGLSLSWPLLLRSTGSRRTGSIIVAHEPSCSKACGIFPDQGSNPCPLHWQADSQPLSHQGSPVQVLSFFQLYHSMIHQTKFRAFVLDYLNNIKK